MRRPINVEELGIVPSHLYKNVGFGSTFKFEVINNKLVAIVGAEVAPTGGSLGEIHITYTYKDNMYQAEQINFIPRWELEKNWLINNAPIKSTKGI